MPASPGCARSLATSRSRFSWNKLRGTSSVSPPNDQTGPFSTDDEDDDIESKTKRKNKKKEQKKERISMNNQTTKTVNYAQNQPIINKHKAEEEK
ncbi:MAG: hypothetical protein Q8P67_11350 [archaeon]|nr:hypothetical protein [archaeon]